MTRHKLGLIGLGKIAHDQHLPAIKGNPAFELVAVASQRGMKVEGVPNAFKSWEEMLERLPALDAVAIATPPQPRHAIARAALEACKHVLLEKPPTATLSELADLERIAANARATLFTTWHSQYNKAVDEARKALSGGSVKRLVVTWKEDVREWHPGQAWIWEAGAFGVFDTGINALSILTRIMPAPLFIRRADLAFPANKDTPIAASLQFGTGERDEDLTAEFEWRHNGKPIWDMELETSDGRRLKLLNGGSRLEIDGKLIADEPPTEYQGIYKRFDELLREGRSEVDTDPFRLVGDAFMIGRRTTGDAFQE
jgi:D-galactose 1-dehydrogenase